MRQELTCLINQSACGRIQGNPVCPKCDMDERVVYPGQADREAAQTAGLARYWETHAKGLEQQVRQGEKAAKEVKQSPPAAQPPVSPQPEAPRQAHLRQSAKSSGFNWAWVPMLVALLGVSVYFKFQREQDQRRIEELGRMVAQTNTPSTAERILGGASQKVAPPVRQPFEPEMVRIPAGSFTMGSPASEPLRKSDEGPQHTVQVAAFEMGKTEVTFAHWDLCVVDGGCSHRPADQGWGRGSRPVINVSWRDITAQYIPWLNRKTGKRYRLPTEAEWEYAARANCTSAFSVGTSCNSKLEPSDANFDGSQTYNGSSKGARLGKTVRVGGYLPNRWNLYDMHGNVWEWVQDCYIENYEIFSRTGGQALSSEQGCDSRVLRGGSWAGGPQSLRSTRRSFGNSDHKNYVSGFRVARTI